jgi:hypothetical protein
MLTLYYINSVEMVRCILTLTFPAMNISILQKELLTYPITTLSASIYEFKPLRFLPSNVASFGVLCHTLAEASL